MPLGPKWPCARVAKEMVSFPQIPICKRWTNLRWALKDHLALLFYFGQFRLWANLRWNIMMRGVYWKPCLQPNSCFIRFCFRLFQTGPHARFVDDRSIVLADLRNRWETLLLDVVNFQIWIIMCCHLNSQCISWFARVRVTFLNPNSPSSHPETIWIEWKVKINRNILHTYYGKCSKILNTSFLQKWPRQTVLTQFRLPLFPILKNILWIPAFIINILLGTEKGKSSRF